jgi:MarR family transcriptional regulator for hemolysin
MGEAGGSASIVTHRLNAAERQGLVRRWREPDKRRVQRVELTPEGIATFDRLWAVAVGHEERLRAEFTPGRARAVRGLPRSNPSGRRGARAGVPSARALTILEPR